MDTAQFWDEALSLDDYVGQMWRKNRKIFYKNRERTVIDAPRATALPSTRRILILTEHYCEDSLQLCPSSGDWRTRWRPSLCASCDSISIPELASRYQTAGHPAIPVFIVLNSDGQELGALIERTNACDG